MRYYVNLFSSETAEAFTKSDQDTSGFRISRKTYITNQNIGQKDIFICYCTRIQRFIGVFEIMSKPFVDENPFLLSLKILSFLDLK